MTILLTGIPGSGKTGLMNIASHISSEPFCEVSCSRIFEKQLLRHNYNPNRVAYISPQISRAYRSLIPHECARQIGEYKEHLRLRYGGEEREPTPRAIIETPLTVRRHNGIMMRTFGVRDFDILSSPPAQLPISRVVSVVDDPKRIVQRNIASGHEGYPTGEDGVRETLDWISQESDYSLAVAEHATPGMRALIIPREGSQTTLSKILRNPVAPVVYLAYPITYTRGNPEARDAVDRFASELDKYCVVVRPILLADEGTSHHEEQHTIHRDLEWFVPQADFVVAYYPADVVSKGVATEVNHAIELGKHVVRIHPKEDTTVFGKRGVKQFEGPDGFFEAVRKSRSEGGDITFSKLIDSEGNPVFKDIVEALASW